MSNLPQIEWRGAETYYGQILAVAGELKVGKRRLRHAVMINDRSMVLQAAEMIEAKLWTMNYYESLRGVRDV